MKFFGKMALLFCVAGLVVCGVFLFNLTNTNQSLQMQSNQMTKYKIQLENEYEKAFFELTDSVKNMQANLSKLHASNGKVTQQTLITKIVGQAETAESDVGSLPLDNSLLQKTAEFANKTSDYCLYLQTKLAKGDQLNKQDRQTLKKLADISQNLSAKLVQTSRDVGYGVMLSDGILRDGKNAKLDASFEDINKNTFDYPQMIYDGPFADNKTHVVKIDKPHMTHQEVQAKITKELEQFYVDDIKYTGETKNNLDVYNFEVNLKNGSTWYLQASQNGGMVCFVSCNGCKGKPDTKTDAMQKATQFAKAFGYDVQPVWVSKEGNGCTYVNLAPIVSGVIIYPDLVKVSVDDNGVCGFEGLGYLANHKNRIFDKMSRNDGLARQKLAEGMTVKNSNLALVPKGESEVLCFEFECEMDGDQYFVFIDVNTLEEVDIFKVIEGTEGYSVL